MLTAETGPADGLDARAKLCFQVGFAVAVFSTGGTLELGVLAAVAALALAVARLSPLAVLRAYWFVFAILALGPVGAALRLGPPWVDPRAGLAAATPLVRVGLVLAVSAAYVRTTPVRETRAAIQRHVPGRAGQLFGVGVALVVRFLPVLRRELRTTMEAMAARLGSERSVVDRAERIGIVGLSRAFTQADRLTLALRARCFAWNPTLPALTFRRRDYLVMLAGGALAAWPLVRLVPGRLIPFG
jgi:biotin transport system permease protein